jgi:toxin ParE1/3/4
MRKIYARVTRLEKFPYMGCVVPEIGDKNIRELIEGKYRLIYELLGEDIILIQKIFHSSRDFGSLNE